MVLPLGDNGGAAQLAPDRVLDHFTTVARMRPLILTGPRGDATETARAILTEAGQTQKLSGGEELPPTPHARSTPETGNHFKPNVPVERGLRYA